MTIRERLAAYTVRWRTLAGGFGLLLAGVVQEVGVADIRAFLADYIGDEHVLGAVVIGISAWVVYRRFKTDQPVFQARDPAEQRSGRVDEGE